MYTKEKGNVWLPFAVFTVSRFMAWDDSVSDGLMNSAVAALIIPLSLCRLGLRLCGRYPMCVLSHRVTQSDLLSEMAKMNGLGFFWILPLKKIGFSAACARMGYMERTHFKLVKTQWKIIFQSIKCNIGFRFKYTFFT